VPVYVIQEHPWSLVGLSRYVRRPIVWNYAEAGPERTVGRLLELAAQLQTRPILVAVDDVATRFSAENHSALRSGFVFPEQTPEVVRAVSNKRDLFHLCKQHDIPTPEMIEPQDRQDVLQFLDTATFPVVIKSSDPELLSQRKNARSVTIVNSADALLSAYDEMEVPGQPNLMLQEYIPGGSDSIWMFDGYFNHDSECLFGVAGQKIRQYPRRTGPTSLGICLRNAEVEAQTRTLMKAIGYRGLLDLGYRYDARDGKYKLLDVNARLGATFRLFRGSEGLDVIQAMYLDLTGQPIPPWTPRTGSKWVVEPDDILTYLTYFRDGSLPFVEWLRSLADVEEWTWLALDDPLPALVRAAMLLVRGPGQVRQPVD